MTYCQLVDNARLYFTNALEGPPKVRTHFSFFVPIKSKLVFIWYTQIIDATLTVNSKMDPTIGLSEI